jgi:hypothetical protein
LRFYIRNLRKTVKGFGEKSERESKPRVFKFILEGPKDQIEGSKAYLNKYKQKSN